MDFPDFLKQRESASNAYIRGDAGPLAEMLTRSDPASFMPPSGAVVSGASDARDAQVEGAKAFGPRSTGRFVILGSGDSGDLAYWTGLQVASADLDGSQQPQQMVLRVTEIFRREDGAWRLVHRHADQTDQVPADASGPPSSQ